MGKGNAPITQTITFSSSVERPQEDPRYPFWCLVFLKSCRREAPASLLVGSSGLTAGLRWKKMNSVTPGIFLVGLFSLGTTE